MKLTCPNKALDSWKKLVTKFGEDKAYFYWNKYDGEIPENLNTIIKDKVEFKKAQILIPHSKLVALFEKTGKNYKELSSNEIKALIEPEVLEGLSYRIPNQGPPSNDVFEIVGILPPEMGDTMVSFKEITTKTGSDFDIDKSFLILPNFRYDDKTGKIVKVEEDDSKKGLQNRRFNLTLKMMSNPEKYAQLMSPLDAPWLSDLINGTDDTKGLFPANKEKKDLHFFTGTNQLLTKSLFDNAKNLVGVIAKHMSHHNLIKHENMAWNDYYIGKGPRKVEVIEQIIEPTNVSTEATTNYKKLNFNKEQSEAINNIKEFLNSKEDFYLLEGKAGTGKTTIIAEALRDKFGKKDIVVAALSHKAKQVLVGAFAKNGIKSSYRAETLASMLGMKMDLETGKFSKEPGDFGSITSTPVEEADIIVVDEASMLNEEALELIKELKSPNAKVIFLADIGQLPPIREKSSPAAGKNSPIFNVKNKSKLIERVRQGETSPILPFADYYWNNSQSINPLINPIPNDIRKSVFTKEGNLIFTTSKGILDATLPEFKKAVEEENPNIIKFVAYTNKVRQSINNIIHKNLFPNGDEYNKGELLIFLDNYKISKNEGFTNSDEVQVQSAKAKKINIGAEQLNGYELLIPNFDSQGKKIISKVNVISKEDKPKYDAILSNLFAEAAKLPKGKERAAAYKFVWEQKNKVANIDYGYAITSHKSQGSTYNSVVVMEDDIMNVQPTTSKEKSQSMYTAITRASDNVVIVSNNNTKEDNIDLSFRKPSKENNIEESSKSNASDFINYSGAAKGADTIWENIGKEFGIGKQVNYTPETLSKLNEKQLEEIEDSYLNVVKTLGRKVLDKNTYSGKLVRRDYLQAKAADAIFAISTIDLNKNLVNGGTAYATHSAINMGKPVYVFNQNDNQWYTWKDNKFVITNTPTLTKKYAGIGTREINEFGIQAIKDVYEKTFNDKEDKSITVGSTVKRKTVTQEKSNLSVEKDEVGNSVEESLIAYANAIVDAAKDPFITRANINQFTANTAFMLIRAGVDREWVTAFMGQPILIDLVEEMNISEGRISEKQRDPKTGNIITALDKILTKYNYTLGASTFKKNLSSLSLRNTETNNVEISNKELIRNINSSAPTSQLAILAQFLEWQGKAKAISDLMTITSSDTTGATKNQISASLFINKVNNVIKQNNFSNLDKMMGFTLDINGNPVFSNKKMIGAYYKNSILKAKEMFKDLFLTETSAFNLSLFNIANNAGYRELELKDEDLANIISTELYSALLSKSPVAFSNKNDINTLLYNKSADISWGNTNPEDLSLANEIVNAKTLDIFKDNNLIQSLDVKFGINKNDPDLISLSAKNLDVDAKNNLFLDWEQVLEVNPKLGEKLIKYAYYSSGFKTNFGVFFEHIPMEELLKLGFDKFILDKFKSLNENPLELRDLESQIFKHLYKNNKLVPTVNNTVLKPIKINDKVIPNDYAIALESDENSELYIGNNYNGTSEYKRFVKRIIVVPAPTMYDPENTKTIINLYQLAGYQVNSNEKDAKGEYSEKDRLKKDSKTLVYLRTNTLGYNKGLDIIKEYGGDGNISIFEENNVTLPQEVIDYVSAIKVYPETVVTNFNENLIDFKSSETDESRNEDLFVCKYR